MLKYSVTPQTLEQIQSNLSECSANIFLVLERNVHRSEDSKSIQEQMIECNCWRILDVCSEWNDTCVILMCAGVNFWSNDFKIELSGGRTYWTCTAPQKWQDHWCRSEVKLFNQNTLLHVFFTVFKHLCPLSLLLNYSCLLRSCCSLKLHFPGLPRLGFNCGQQLTTETGFHWQSR